MKGLLSILVIFTLLFSNFQPFFLFFSSINSNIKRIEEENRIAEEPVEDIIIDEDEQEEEEFTVRLNSTLDLDGYCTIMYPTKYFDEISEQTDFTRKALRYEDNKSRLTMSYVTNIAKNTDIPGYIVKELAGVDTVTNSKYEQDFSGQTWMVVPASDSIDGKDITVYYKLADDEKTAFWLKVEVYPDSEDEVFDKIITTMLGSYHMYYIGESIFETPTTGYYAENNVDDNGTVGNTEDYQANSDENTVYQVTTGIDYGAQISYDWKDLQIIIDDKLLQLPNTLDDYYSAGFSLNDTRFDSTEGSVLPGNEVSVKVINGNGTVINLVARNDSNVDIKALKDCTIVKIIIDTSEFETLANNNVEEQKTEEEGQENEEEQPVEVQETPVDRNKHNVILACGVTLEAYTNDITDYFGSKHSTSQYGSDVEYVWTGDNCYMKIRAGLVQKIKYIELSAVGQ